MLLDRVRIGDEAWLADNMCTVVMTYEIDVVLE